MLFAIICTDRPASLCVRLAARPAHRVHRQTSAAKVAPAKVALADPSLEPDGFLTEVADPAGADGIAAADPYAKTGLFESTIIRPFRSVFTDGEPVGL
ncbi:MAG: YciI family protein [Acetobacteraceae bacterium]|nr:YciI family protein [Acetobacteraceae bacterium]